MAANSWDSLRARQEMARLVAPGVLGFYAHVEATAVIAFPPGQTEPVNVFSILVTEERLAAVVPKPVFLNPKRIRLKSLKDWFFGVRRYLLPIAESVRHSTDFASPKNGGYPESCCRSLISPQFRRSLYRPIRRERFP